MRYSSKNKKNKLCSYEKLNGSHKDAVEFQIWLFGQLFKQYNISLRHI